MTSDEYAKHYGVKFGKVYTLGDNIVVPFNPEHAFKQDSVGSGFIHYVIIGSGVVDFCGVFHFQRNAKLLTTNLKVKN